MSLSLIYEKTETEWYHELSWDYKVRNVARIWTLLSLNPAFFSEAVYIFSNIMPILILNPVKMQLGPKGNICGTSLICGQLPSQCGLRSCQNSPLYLSFNWETLPLLLLLLSCFSCVRLCDPRDGSSLVPGILQARTLEWVAISFSSAWKWKVKVKSLSGVWLLATPWTAAYQAPLSMGFIR